MTRSLFGYAVLAMLGPASAYAQAKDAPLAPPDELIEAKLKQAEAEVNAANPDRSHRARK
jgi:hypothetical protein